MIDKVYIKEVIYMLTNKGQCKIVDKMIEYGKENVPTNISGCGTPELQAKQWKNPTVIKVKVKRRKSKK